MPVCKPSALRFPFRWAHTAVAMCLPMASYATDAQLPELTVKGEALQSSRAAYSVPTLHRDDIQAAGVTETQALWRNILGMHVSDYQLSGVANSVVLRGFSGAATAVILQRRWMASR